MRAELLGQALSGASGSLDLAVRQAVDREAKSIFRQKNGATDRARCELFVVCSLLCFQIRNNNSARPGPAEEARLLQQFSIASPEAFPLTNYCQYSQLY